MRKKTSVMVLIIITLLFSLAAGGCKKDEATTGTAQAPAQSTTGEKKTEAKQDVNTDSNQQSETNANQYTNNVSTEKKPSMITLVKVQVNNAATNPNPFHVSLDGQVGASAARLTPGSSTMLQKDVYQTGGKYPITLTISRNGEAVAVINQNLNSSNVSVVITETAPNQFKAQWN